MNSIKEKFNQLESREKLLVSIGIAAVLLLLVYLLLVSPIIKKKARLDRQWQKANADIAWVQENGQALMKLRANGAGNQANRNLTSLLNNAAINSGLAMKRFQPKGNNEAQVWFEQVSYNKLLDWIDNIERQQGLTLKKVNITDAGENNVVDVNVVVQSG